MSLKSMLRGKGGGKGLINTTTGVTGTAFRGAGVGMATNWIDKKLLSGKLTATGFNITALPQVNGKTICFNATDAVAILATIGIPKLSVAGLISAVACVGLKKGAELYDILDPPSANVLGQPQQTVTVAPAMTSMPPTVH